MIIPHRIYSHYLRQLKNIIKKIAEEKKIFILEQSLSDDMFPFYQQVKITIGFSLRSCCPLVNKDIVSFDDDGKSIESLLNEITKTIAYLESISIAEYKMEDSRSIDTVAGFAELSFCPDDYFVMYTLPNFFFHLTMVYAIAKKSGLDIGKADYDGYHGYPPGFSFVDK